MNVRNTAVLKAFGTLSALLWCMSGDVSAQTSAETPISQLRASTFIAGSEAAGETLARSIALEIATAPLGSSSGGFTFSFDPSTRSFQRRSRTFGPSFTERAQTSGRGKMSAGLNFIYRRYVASDRLSLSDFDVFRFQGGTLPVSFSRMSLELQTSTIAAFGSYGISDKFDVGVLVPFVRMNLTGSSRIYDSFNNELQRVSIDASRSGLGDVAVFGKYRLWNGAAKGSGALDSPDLAVSVTVRMPTGNVDDLLGLGLTRSQFALIGSATRGRLSPHLNLGYDLWSGGFEVPRDFQGLAVNKVKDQVLYSGGVEIEATPQLSVVVDALGQFLRGGGRIDYQPFTFPTNYAGVRGAEALVAVPSGRHTLLLAPGAKWNFFRNALLTANVLVPLTRSGLRTRVTPVVGIDWGF